MRVVAGRALDGFISKSGTKGSVAPPQASRAKAANPIVGQQPKLSIYATQRVVIGEVEAQVSTF
jgi:hypothetical protein